MPKVHHSPLDGDDLNVLEALAQKALAHVVRPGVVPLFVAIDSGCRDQPDAYLLICWPALDRKAARVARLIFETVSDLVEDMYGGSMLATEPAGAKDGPER